METTDFNSLSKQLSGKGGLVGSSLLLVIVFLIGSLLVWANYTELDNVTRGQGKVISSMQNQTIQSSESGVIKVLYVKKGDVVTQNDLLFEIDPIDSKTELEQATQRLTSLRIQRTRLFAEISGEELIFDPELVTLSPSVIDSERSLYTARRADLIAQQAVLKRQLANETNKLKRFKLLPRLRSRRSLL